jgi:hypothetical protein
MSSTLKLEIVSELELNQALVLIVKSALPDLSSIAPEWLEHITANIPTDLSPTVVTQTIAVPQAISPSRFRMDCQLLKLPQCFVVG